MKIINPNEKISFNKEHAIADPLFINKNNRLLRFSLLPCQSIKEHKSPSSPVLISIIKGRGLLWGEDGEKKQIDTNLIIIFTQNETHGISVLDEEQVFLALLHGSP